MGNQVTHPATRDAGPSGPSLPPEPAFGPGTNQRRRRPRWLTVPLLLSAALWACGESDSPTTPNPDPDPDPEPEFDFNRPLMAFETDRDLNWEIYVSTEDGTEVANITNAPLSTEWDADWSTDRQQIAFRSDRGGDVDLYVMDRDGSNVVNLTNHPASDADPSWSPDGSKIAFRSNRDGDTELYVMDADGTNVQRLTFHPATDAEPRWSPDGSKILWRTTRSGNSDLWVMDVAVDADSLIVSNPLNVTAHPAFECAPEWGPDSFGISFVTDRDGDNEVYLMNIDGTGVTNLTNSPNSSEFWSGWSLDGLTLVFDSNRNGDEDLFLIDADGTNLRPLVVNDATDDEVPRWR